jgi:hypothetical protein
MKRRGMKNRVVKMAAGLAVFSMLILFMMAPMTIFRVLAGIPLNERGPSWEVWLLVLGGGIGAGVARLSHDLILRKFAGLSEKEIEDNWSGR